VVEDRGGKKPRPDQTAGQRKGLWAEASFCLEFLHTFLSRKKYEQNRFLTLLIKQKGKSKTPTPKNLPVPTCNY